MRDQPAVLLPPRRPPSPDPPISNKGKPDILALDRHGKGLLYQESSSDVFGGSSARASPALRREHPTDVEQKARPTFFTDLSTTSSRSGVAAEALRGRLRKYFSIRVEPPAVVIADYTPGSCHTSKIRILNASSRVQRVELDPPREKITMVNPRGLANQQILSPLLIAPGLEAEITIEFIAPQPTVVTSIRDKISTSSIENDRFKTYMGSISVEFGGKNESIVVPLSAHPAGAKLEFNPILDFGTLVACGAGRKNEEEMDERNWVTRSVTITNIGFRRADYICLYDRDLPIRITPNRGSLASVFEEDINNKSLSSSCTLQVSFLPSQSGTFREEVFVELQNSFSRDPSAGIHWAPAPPQRVSISATVLSHKLRLRDADNTRDLDPQNLDFGVIYYGQNVFLPAKLENSGPTVVKWVITYAGNNAPMVPGKRVTAASEPRASEDDLNTDRNTSMSSLPSEGILMPYCSTMVNFKFTPQIVEPSRGFKSIRVAVPPREYRVPMQLKIINSSAHQAGEEPININLIGGACPVLADISSHKVHFEPTFQGSQRVVELRLRNTGSHLPFRFRFEKIAHFKADPETGTLKPQSEATINVRFQPHQLGLLKKALNCIISS
ncbi:hypothetical protein BDK51DRAFT_22236, partial [Blyttiomyces helicus]